MVFARNLSALPSHTARRKGGVLDESAYVILTLLERSGPLSITELAKVLGSDASTLNRQTAALLRTGLADRIADPTGGIARKFSPTADGIRMLQEERTASQDALTRLTESWPEADQISLATLMERLNRAIEERTGRAWPRGG